MIGAIFQQAWLVLLEAAPYLLFGYFIAGLLHSFLNPDSVIKYLGKSTVRSVFFAALFGIPLPLCSCGVLPTALALRKKGASPGALAAFFIATPETGIDSLSITYALLGSVMAVVRPLVAILTACVAGVAVNIFAKQNVPDTTQTEPKSCCAHPTTPSISVWRKFTGGMRYAYVDLVADVAKSFLLGLLIAGALSALVPENFFTEHVGQGFVSLLVALVGGIPMYVCATASTPIVAMLMMKGLSPGAALVFLLVGPATNAASLTMIASIFGKRFIALYLSTIVVMSLGAGLLFNQFFASSDWTRFVQASHEHHQGNTTLQIASAVLLLALMLYALVLRKK